MKNEHILIVPLQEFYQGQINIMDTEVCKLSKKTFGMYTHTCVQTYTHVCVQACMCTDTHKHTHTYTLSKLWPTFLLFHAEFCEVWAQKKDFESKFCSFALTEPSLPVVGSIAVM
jgi:hypothetical protein